MKKTVVLESSDAALHDIVKTRKPRSDKGKKRGPRKNKQLAVKNELICQTSIEGELMPKESTFNVAGRNWSSLNIKRFTMVEGRSIEETLTEAFRRCNIVSPNSEVYDLRLREWLGRCQCRINNVDIPRDQWGKSYPSGGSFIEFIVAPAGGGGGGSGKGILQPILMIAVAIASIFTFGAAAAAYGVAMGVAEGATMMGVLGGSVTMTAGMYMAGAVAAMAVSTIGSMIVSKICPTTVSSPQQSVSSSSAESSQTYSISGAKNSASTYNYLPLVLGQYRLTPPLGAKSWTETVRTKSKTTGETTSVQYYNMLVVWGHPDVTVEDIRIGDTSIDSYGNDSDGQPIVTHVFHQATYGNDLVYFGRSYNEQSVSVELAFDHAEKYTTLAQWEADHPGVYGDWHLKEVGECDAISVDIYFAALTDVSEEETKAASVSFEIQYAISGNNPTWKTYAEKVTFTTGVEAQHIDTYTGADRDDLWCTYEGTFTARQEGDWDDEGWPVGKIRVPIDGTLAGTDADGKVVGYWSEDPISRYKDKHKHHEWWTKPNVKFTGTTTGVVTCAGDDTTGITFNYTWSVPHGNYQVRIRRRSWDRQDSKVQDTATWKTVRAITNKPSFNTPLPICVSEIHIQASDTVNGYISDLTGLCTSTIPVYDASTGTWDTITSKNINTELNGKNWDGYSKPGVNYYIYDGKLRVATSSEISDVTKTTFQRYKETRAASVSGYTQGTDEYTEALAADPRSKTGFNVAKTRNPADILYYLFTSRHSLNSPFTTAKLNMDSLKEFWIWCNDNDYKFDYVCDTEEAAWSRWVSVASAGRGSITLDQDGLFSVVIDRPGKLPVQMFTPRNSWGFSIDRTFYKMPHALRVSYYQQIDVKSEDGSTSYIDYENRDGYIYADGYDITNATDIQEWNFTGKTDWNDLYKMGRYYLASIKLRPLSITLNTDWEWLMCHRGDLVSVAHDVLMNTFGTARVIALIYKENDATVYDTNSYSSASHSSLPVGVKIDDSVIFSEMSQYGIAIRQSSGSIVTYEIVMTGLNDETDDLMFRYPENISTSNVPYVGALCSVSTLGQEKEDYLVVSMNVSGDDNSCELELAPYKADEIYASVNGPIPDWVTPIKLDTVSSNNNTLPTPSIDRIRTDESVLIRSGDSIISCLAVWWNLPTGIPDTFKRIYCNLQVKDSQGHVFNATADTTSSSYVFVQGVEDGKEYSARIRLSSETGVVSKWTDWQTVTILGKSANPQDLENFVLTIVHDSGVVASWDEPDTYDLDYYEINYTLGSTEGQGKTSLTSYAILPYNYNGEVTASGVAVDTLGNKSLNAVSGSVTTLVPDAPYINTAVLKNDGVNISWNTKPTSFDIKSTTFSASSSGASSLVVPGLLTTLTTTCMPCPSTWAKYDTATAISTDIFNNEGREGSSVISWYVPKTPVVSYSMDTKGNLILKWDDCKNTLEGAPDIDYYEIVGTITQTSKNPVHAKGLSYTAAVPLDVYVYGEEYDDEGNKVRVATISVTVTAVDKYGITSKDYDANYGITCDGATKYTSNTITIKVYEPKTPTNIWVSGFKDADGGDAIILNWTDCGTTFGIDHYDLYDSYTNTTYSLKATSLALPLRSAGTYPLKLTAYDNLGQVSGTLDYNLIIAGVGGMQVTSKIDGSDVLIEWSIPESSFAVDRYIIAMDNDVASTLGDKLDSLYLTDDIPEGIPADGVLIPLIPADSDIDIDGDKKLDVTADKTYTVGEYTALKSVSVESAKDTDIVLGSYYSPEYGNGETIGMTKSTYFRVPGGTEGTYIYYVWAVDAAGNISTDYASYTTIEINGPKAPKGKTGDTITAEHDNEYVIVDWADSAKSGDNTLPIVHWDVVRQHEITDANGTATDTKEIDYGRIDVDQLKVFAFEYGEHTFMVRGIDTGGNVGPWGYVDFTVARPGKIAFTNNLIIDNNVQIYWTMAETEIFFPIAYYIVVSIEDGYAAEVTRVDGQFAGLFEMSTGSYRYGVIPVDVAGNTPDYTETDVSNISQIVVELALPSDFVFYDQYESTFNGNRLNMDLVEYASSMIGPVNRNETWEENIERIRGDVDADKATWETKDKSGSDSWLLPEGSGLKTVRTSDGSLWARIYYQDVTNVDSDPSSLMPSQIEAWYYENDAKTNVSYLGLLRDKESWFRKSNDEPFEFMIFQEDATGPEELSGGDGSVYLHWTQTSNPAFNQDVVTDYTVAGSSNVRAALSGLSLSVDGASALMDMYEGTKYQYGNVGAVRLTSAGGINSITSVTSKYSQLWAKMVKVEDIAVYTEKVDHIRNDDTGEATISSTSALITPTYTRLYGNPELQCVIYTSLDGVSWTLDSSNSSNAYASDFKYGFYTLIFTGGVVDLTSINYRLDVKKVQDYGRVTCNATDAGDGAPDEYTGVLRTGTWIPFNTHFTDVQSLPKPNVVVTDSVTEGYSAYTVFLDTVNPEGFLIYVLDKNGNRVTADVDWVAYGV